MQADGNPASAPNSSSTHVPGVGQEAPWVGLWNSGVVMYKHKHRACIKLSPYPSSVPCIVLCPVSIVSSPACCTCAGSSRSPGSPIPVTPVRTDGGCSLCRSGLAVRLAFIQPTACAPCLLKVTWHREGCDATSLSAPGALLGRHAGFVPRRFGPANFRPLA